MTAWLPVVAVLAALALAHWAGDTLQDWVGKRLVRRSRGRAWRAALTTATFHVGCLLLLGLFAGMARSVAEVYDVAWVGAVTGFVGMVGYLQLIWCSVPSRSGGYDSWRSVLEEHGANRAEQQAVIWTGAPFALLGLGLSVAVLVVVL